MLKFFLFFLSFTFILSNSLNILKYYKNKKNLINLNDIYLSNLLERNQLKQVKEQQEQEVQEQEEEQQEENDNYILLCSQYKQYKQFNLLLLNYNLTLEYYHPVYISLKDNEICYFTYSKTIKENSYYNKNHLKIYTIYNIPHILKLDESISKHIDIYNKEVQVQQQIQNNKIKNNKNNNDNKHLLTVELSYGLGVHGKGKLTQSIQDYSSTLLHLTNKILVNEIELKKHFHNFYYTTNNKLVNKLSHKLIQSQSNLFNYYNQLKDTLSNENNKIRCNYNDLHIETTKSHIIYTQHPNKKLNSMCVEFLISVASLQSEISYITITYGESISDITGRTNAPYQDAAPATDQNAWVQSGTSTDTPYTDIGIDGSGYILGMIDTGLDDLSCFLIDTSGEQTTRTPRSNYTNPVTEMFRRKVVQYIAWADGEPSIEYDHGTWCAGASLGQCIDSTSSASDYNGVAPSAKISIFDVDVSATENYLNVPSLYDIALPIAYNIGARVHSNSWTTYYMSSYTSKSIEVDEFTYENQDFLFIAGAGNSGDTGFNSVTSPANSKNTIAVGASSVNHNNIVSFSSLGSSYDTAFKPNIVAPGRYLQSAGVRMENQTNSCNVEISSGTSMATPIIAGSAILIRHYLENSSYWGKFCNPEYKSCPVIVPSKSNPNVPTFISSALLRAAIIHSGAPMDEYESSTKNLLPATNLTYPPNNYEGWGQLRLSNVLPIPNVYNFDLYVRDYVSIESLTRHTYHVTVTDSTTPLKVTIAWIDPPNVNWGVKNLLNDIDLILVLPTGASFFGNSIIGDEYNPQEKIVLNNPLTGNYKIFVQSKVFAIPDNQKYSIVITSNGYISESKFKSEKISIDDISTTDPCSTIANTKHVQFQLEDWESGESWIDNSISMSVIDSKTSVLHSECKFTSNEDQQKAEFTRTSQCSLCLSISGEYDVQLRVNQSLETKQDIPVVVRAVSPQCDVYLSSYQQSGKVSINKNGDCNICSSGSYVTVTMYANVTDDDESQYSWYGLASYSIHNANDNSLFSTGTLTISDQEADIYCIDKGTYTFSFNDTLLYSTYRKHGQVIFTLPDGSTLTFTTTSSETIKVVIPDTSKDDDEDEDHGLSQGAMIGISIGGAIVGVLILTGLFYFFFRKEDSNESLLPQRTTK